MPFTAFGHLPILFDAPSPDPGLRDQVWHADTFLVAGSDVFFTRRLFNVVGFCWGYRIEQKQPTISQIEPLPQARWEDHLPFLRRRYPSWEFL